MRLLLDADTINYALKGVAPVAERLDQAILESDEFLLCPVVEFEVTRHLKLTGAGRMLRLYRKLVSPWQVVDLSFEDWDMAADLWAERHRAGRPIDDADLLIAVTARKSSAILVTNNLRHFEGLGLTLDNWAA